MADRRATEECAIGLSIDETLSFGEYRPVGSTNRKFVTMREVQASAAKTHLPQLLDEVERGETIIITRHGRPIARLVPEIDRRREASRAAIADLKRFRRTMPQLSVPEILDGRHAGHKY